MSEAKLNLVRLNTLYDTETHSYEADGDSALHVQRDEIELVSPEGEPCALIAPTAVQPGDHRFDYITGAKGHQARVNFRRVTLPLDWVGNDLARRLADWKQQKARVLICPDYGRRTYFFFRPIALTGGQYTVVTGDAYDGTGVRRVGCSFNDEMYLWDDERRVFAELSASDKLTLFRTPGGAGIGGADDQINRVYPPSPEGATPGFGSNTVGWELGGVDSGDLTLNYNVPSHYWYFGLPDAPEYLSVTVGANVSTDRYMIMRDCWDSGSGDYQGYSFTGSGVAYACVWLKGRMPDGAKLYFGQPGDLSEVDLSGETLGEWTPILVCHYSSDWTASVPYLLLDLRASTAHEAHFGLGPTMVSQDSPGKVWTPNNASLAGSASEVTCSGIWPDTGTLVVSAWVPEDVNDYQGVVCGLFGDDSSVNTTFNAYRHAGTGAWTLKFSTTSETFSETVVPTPGAINTFAFTWQTDELALYCNGVQVGLYTTATDTLNLDLPVAVAGEDFRVGRDGIGNHCNPMRVLTARMDEGAMSATEIAQEHVNLTDPAVRDLALECRGRVFEITGLPKIVRSASGGSELIGNLVLDQVDYLHEHADLTTQEGSNP